MCSTPASLSPSDTNVTRSSMVASSGGAGLPVQPHLLHARVIVDDVVRDQVLDVRPLHEVAEAPAQDRLGHVRLELALDLHHQVEALLGIDLPRLSGDQVVNLGAAIFA